MEQIILNLSTVLTQMNIVFFRTMVKDNFFKILEIAIEMQVFNTKF